MERMTIADAAKHLNLTQEAIRQRIRRGTIENHKGEDGRTYVYLDTEAEQDAGGHRSSDNFLRDYINALKDQIEMLEVDRDSWRVQAERKDTIIMSMTNKLPQPPPEYDPNRKRELEGSKLPLWRRIFR